MTADLRNPAQPADAVNHPPHYTSSPAKCRGCGRPIECIDVTAHMNFPVGSVVKYLWRLDLKVDAIEDLRKAAQYIEFEIKRREAEQLSTPNPTLRILLDESQALIKERYGDAIEELGRT